MFFVSTDDTSANYVWEVMRDGMAWDTVRNGVVYAGATNDSLSVLTADSMSGYMYRVISYNDSGSTSSDTVRLQVNLFPVVSAITGSASAVCVGSTVMLMNATSGGSWSSSDTAIATIDAAGAVTLRTNGMVTFQYAVANGCGTRSATFPLTVDTVLVHETLTAGSAICVGSLMRIITIRPGGTWSSSNGSVSVASTGWVTGIRHGIDTVTYIYTNGCGTDTSMHYINVDTSIIAGTVSGPNNVCYGSSVMFTSSLSGGTWLSSNTTIANVDASGTVTGRAMGMAIITYFFSNSCGLSVAMDTIHVDNPVAAITGRDSVGIGNTIMLSNTTIGGAWSTSDTSVTVSFTTGLVTGVFAGMATITYTATNACGTTSVTKMITVGAATTLPAITGNDSVCQGRNTAFANTETGGTWSVTNGAAAVTSTGSVTGIIGGRVDTIVYTLTNGFGMSSISKAIKVVESPPVVSVSGPAAFLLAVPYTLVATPAGGTWVSLFPDRVAFTTSTNFVVLKKGITPLVYTFTNACGTTRDTFVVNMPDDNSVAIYDNGEGNLNIYPNPTTGNVMISVNSLLNEEVTVTISNVTGQVIHELKTTTNKLNSVSLTQPAGLYIIQAASSKGKHTSRLTISE